MNQLDAKSVVVGVNGSQAAVSAAKWAIDEAISRQMPLRLVYVTRAHRRALGRRAPSGSSNAAKWRCPKRSAP